MKPHITKGLLCLALAIPNLFFIELTFNAIIFGASIACAILQLTNKIKD